MHLRTLTALVGIMVGVLCGKYSVYGSEIAMIAGICALFQVVLLFAEKYKEKMNIQRSPSLFSLEESPSSRFSLTLVSAVFFLCVTVGVIRAQFIQEKNNFVCEPTCLFYAIVTNSPKIKNDYQVFSVHTESKNNDVYDIQIKAPLYPRYEVGDHLVLSGKVTLPKTIMPHDTKKTFDYEMYLRVHDIGSEMYYPTIEKEARSEQENSFALSLVKMKESFVKTIALYVNEPAASLSSGMLFGATSMSQELIQTFRVAGLSHIVVLSGFNIAILISFVLFVLVFVPLILRVILASLFVILFVVMVGGEASIVRATLMSFVGLVALVVGRAYTARQALILSLIAIIMYEPLHLFHDVSLHLSFLAAAGIIYMGDGVQSILQGIKSRTYREIMSTTLCAYAATLPYVIYTFGTVSIYALFANIIVLPFVPIVMLLTFIVIIVAPFTQILASIVGYVDTVLGEIIIWTARSIEHLPFSSFLVSISGVTMIIVYAAIAVGYFFLVRKFSVTSKNETSVTRDNIMYSEIISY